MTLLGIAYEIGPSNSQNDILTALSGKK